MAFDYRFHRSFQGLIDDPDLALLALREDPKQFVSELLADERGALSTDTAIPAMDALGILIFDKAGRRVPYDGPDWVPEYLEFRDLVQNARQLGPSSRLLSLERGNSPGLYAIWADNAETASWNLPLAVREIIKGNPVGKIALVAGGAADDGAIRAACRTFALTALETRAVMAIIRDGNGRSAATNAGLAYATLREALASATARARAKNLPGLVNTMIAAAFGILPDDSEAFAHLTDMLPLTLRQARLAVSIAEGLTRDEAAKALGVSVAVVKKELETVYTNLEVTTASGLSRLITEVRALRLLARSTDGAPGYYDPAVEPTRLTPRGTDKEVIAWSDYGPSSARPVLIVHSNWQCRAVPRPLLAELHARGFRPISIDRPGFGSTSLGSSTRSDPFSQAVHDTLTVLDVLRVERIPIIARCGAQFVMALKKAAPSRVGPVLLVSPSPQTAEGGLRRNVVGVVKEAFYRSPKMIEFFFRVISAEISLKRVETLTRAIVRGSPTDEAMCDDPQFLHDRLRAIRPFSAGRWTGAVNEEWVISHGGYDFGSFSTKDWTIMQGEQDPHNSFAEVQAYWSDMTPGVEIVPVPDGGRFLTSSHAEAVIKALDKLLN